MKTLKFILPVFFLFQLTIAKSSNSYVFKLDDKHAVKFLNVSDACIEFSSNDRSYFDYLSLLEMSIYSHTDLQKLTHEEAVKKLKSAFCNSIVDWADSNINKIKTNLVLIFQKTDSIGLHLFPDTLKICLNTGETLWGTANCFTLSKCIYYSTYMMNCAFDTKPIRVRFSQYMLLHELIHIFDRNHKSVAVGMHSLFGFTMVDHVDIGEYLKKRCLTNHDQPGYDYYIRVKDSLGKQHTFTAVIYSKRDAYCDTIKAPSNSILKPYYKSSFFEIEKVKGNWTVQNPENPVAYTITMWPDYAKQVGTSFILKYQPEEMVASYVTSYLLSVIFRDDEDWKKYSDEEKAKAPQMLKLYRKNKDAY